MEIWRGRNLVALMAMFSGCWDLFAKTERLEIRRADEVGKQEHSWLPRWTGSTPLPARYQSEDLSWLGLIEAHEALWKGGALRVNGVLYRFFVIHCKWALYEFRHHGGLLPGHDMVRSDRLSHGWRRF